MTLTLFVVRFALSLVFALIYICTLTRPFVVKFAILDVFL